MRGILARRRRVPHIAGLLLGIGLFLPSPALAGSLFNVPEVFGGDIHYFPKYVSMLDRYAQDAALIGNPCGASPSDACYLKDWEDLILSLGQQSARNQIDSVNSYFNHFLYIEDIVNWGVLDYWATPMEFYIKDGDCEDYAIAKYYTLRSLGFAAEQMRIVVLFDTNLGIYHAVLAITIGDSILILDNQLSQVALSTSIYHYQPIFSINELGWWRYG